jgi:hypothetical protein
MEMAVKLKKLILEKLGPTLLKKGFKYDETQSKTSTAVVCVFSKGDPEPSDDWYMKEHNNEALPRREDITIYKMRPEPLITVEMRSLSKPGSQKLSVLAGFMEEKWWSVETEEKTKKSLDQILDLLNHYAWDWFVLK